jgi:hypothetical protein
MKKNLFCRFASALIVVMAAMVLASCPTDTDPGEIPNTGPGETTRAADVKAFAIDISQETDWNYMVVGEDGSSLFINADETTGIPTLAYLKPEKDSDAGFTFLFKENGLPDKVIANGHVLYFGNFSGYKFDMAVIYPNGDIEYHYDIKTDINWDAYGETAPERSLQARAFLDDIRDGFKKTLDFVKKAISAVNLVRNPIGTAINQVANLVIEAVLPPEQAETVKLVKDTIVDVFGCAGGDLLACISGVADAFEYLLYIDLGVANQRAPELAQVTGVINYGRGDVKITLSWNNLADVDLHVVDPDNEEIYFNHRRSASGGALDVDNSYGYGPENIFWPVRGAPAGTYKVYVNFFDVGTSGAFNRSSNYTVSIIAFENTKTYTGTVTSNGGKVLVATFNSNGVITTAGRSSVIPESRSILPSKELLPENSRGN